VSFFSVRMSQALSFRRGRKCNSRGVAPGLPPLPLPSSRVDGNEKRGKRKLRHSGSRFVVAGLVRRGNKAREGSAISQPTFIHCVLLSLACNGMESIWRKKEGTFGLKSVWK